jgi:hypothetical protein
LAVLSTNCRCDAGSLHLTTLPEHSPQPDEKLPELGLVPLLRVQISLVMVNGVNQPSDLVLVQLDLHAS